jgi:hypothetical protein
MIGLVSARAAAKALSALVGAALVGTVGLAAAAAVDAPRSAGPAAGNGD